MPCGSCLGIWLVLSALGNLYSQVAPTTSSCTSLLLVVIAQVASFLSEQAPIQLLQPCFEPWRGGLLSLDGVIARLSELLPPTFEELQRDFAVGVVTADGQHLLVDQGPLPQAVAASAAIPFLFSSVDVPGGSCDACVTVGPTCHSLHTQLGKSRAGLHT
jgi:predicted acylesterase/phospholipase RssA